MSCLKFKEMSFFTLLPKNCHHHLMLPKKFVKNCLVKEFSENISSSTMSLKGPSGQVWAVELMKKNDGLYLKRGWEVFVKEHNLKENDGLFFKYKLGVFDVLMFDNGNFCEKESSYFVRNCHRSNGGLNQKRRVGSEPCSLEIIEPKRQRYKEKSVTSRDEEEEGGDSEAPPRLLARVPACYRRRLTNSVRGCNSKALVRRAQVSVTDDNNKEEESNRVTPFSGKRYVAVKETRLAYQQAVGEGFRRGTPHFAVLIQSSHVSGNCFMTIPARSLGKYLPREHRDVSLKMNGKSWQVKYWYYGKGKSSGFSRSGWLDFVRGNKLEAGDACLFEPTSSSSLSSRTPRNQITFNVSIFRNVV